jgi:hypothetical protein
MFETRNDLLAEIALQEQAADHHEQVARRHRDRIAELEQRLNDLDSGQVTERQMDNATLLELSKTHQPPASYWDAPDEPLEPIPATLAESHAEGEA